MVGQYFSGIVFSPSTFHGMQRFAVLSRARGLLSEAWFLCGRSLSLSLSPSLSLLLSFFSYHWIIGIGFFTFENSQMCDERSGMIVTRGCAIYRIAFGGAGNKNVMVKMMDTLFVFSPDS